MPAIRVNRPIEKGQTTIQAALAGALSYVRPPRPGPVPKDSGRVIGTVLGRRLIGGENERFVQELFAGVRISQVVEGEPGDQDIVEGRIPIDDDDSEDNYYPSKRYKYSREHKLAAIEYFQTTWRALKDGSYERISKRLAAKKLKITRQMLREWICNKERIKEQRRGSYRARYRVSRAREINMEAKLNKGFEEAREMGRKVSYKWMIRYARLIYE